MSYDPEYPDLYDYALVNTEGVVVNVVLWNGEDTGWAPPEGWILVPLPYATDQDGVRRYTGGIGWTYNPKATVHKFVDNRPQEDPDGLD